MCIHCAKHHGPSDNTCTVGGVPAVSLCAPSGGDSIYTWTRTTSGLSIPHIILQTVMTTELNLLLSLSTIPTITLWLFPLTDSPAHRMKSVIVIDCTHLLLWLGLELYVFTMLIASTTSN